MGRERLRAAVATAAWHAHPAARGRAYRFLRKSQWLSPEEIRRVQLEALNAVLAAAREIPFHRERLDAAGIGPEGVRSLDEITALPPLERTDLQQHRIEALRRPGGLVIRRKTSGSTGEPVQTVWSLEMMGWVDAAERRSQDWLGMALGDRRLNVRTPANGSPAVRRLRNAVLNRAWVSARRLGEPGYREAVVEELERNPAAFLVGNTKSMAALAYALDGAGIRPRAVVTSASRLDANYRAVIEHAFGCRVYPRYGTIEIGLVSHPCEEAEAQHVPAEVVLVEIVREDGSPAAPGEVGDVLVTTLRNRTMPLLRYRLGDLAVLADGTCSCGRGLPVLERVVGRTSELLATANGRIVLSGTVVDTILEVAGETLLEFKVVQRWDLRLKILLVQRDHPDAAACRDRLADAFDELIGLPGATVVTRVSELPADRAEKLRVIVSEAFDPNGRLLVR